MLPSYHRVFSNRLSAGNCQASGAERAQDVTGIGFWSEPALGYLEREAEKILNGELELSL